MKKIFFFGFLLALLMAGFNFSEVFAYDVCPICELYSQFTDPSGEPCDCGGEILHTGYCCPTSQTKKIYTAGEGQGACFADPACAVEEPGPCKGNCSGYNGPGDVPCMCGSTLLTDPYNQGGWCCAEDGSTWKEPELCSENSACKELGPCETCKYNEHCQCGSKTTSLQKPFCCKGNLYGGSKECLQACPEAISDCEICKGTGTTCRCGSEIIEWGYCCPSLPASSPYSARRPCEEECPEFAQTCGELGGDWCPDGYSCDGENKTSTATDRGAHPDEICCLGSCEAGEDGNGGNGGNGGDGNGGIVGSVSIELENPLEADTFEELVEGIINFVFMLALAVVPLMVIIGALYLITAGGNPTRVETGKKIIFFAMIGFAIVLLAKGLVALLKNILGVKEAETMIPLFFSSLSLNLKLFISNISKRSNKFNHLIKRFL
jgi:hypothetical protein